MSEKWIPGVIFYGALLLALTSKKSDKQEAPKPAPQKTRRELQLEQQQRDEWARRQAEMERERQAKRNELERQAEEAREEGHVVCQRCLNNDRLTIDPEPCSRCGVCKGCNGDAGSICVSCDDDDRRASDD